MKTDITKADIQRAREALYKAKELEDKLLRIEACGFDCVDLKTRFEHAKKVLTNINEIMGPQFGAK